jgi:hypothetical protein
MAGIRRKSNAEALLMGLWEQGNVSGVRFAQLRIARKLLDAHHTTAAMAVLSMTPEDLG